MNQYELSPEDFDLELTMTCGQTFCWHRVEGELYGEGASEFYTFRDGKPLLVEQKDDVTLFVKTELSQDEVETALGIDHSISEIFDGFPEDQKIEMAKDKFWGLRIINDEFFPCLVSYLCSPQMQIPRIKSMFNQMAEQFGETVVFDGKELLRFPTREELSEVTEEELRDIGVGYRAKYIVETMKILEEEDFDHNQVREKGYEDAREHMKQLYGVGDKVADCILLFSLGFHEACPLDTWASKALEAHYPEIHADKYEETSRNMRKHFGDKAGYAQEYLFHAARNGVLDV